MEVARARGVKIRKKVLHIGERCVRINLGNRDLRHSLYHLPRLHYSGYDGIRARWIRGLPCRRFAAHTALDDLRWAENGK